MRTSTCIPALFLAASLAAQSRIYTVRPRVASRVAQLFGFSVAGPGDVNADGYPDFFVGGRPTKENPFNAWVYSGRTGTLLHAFPATPDPHHRSLAKSIAGAGDVDRDGHADLIVGMRNHGMDHAGMVRVYSGKDGRLLYTFRGTGQGQLLGYRVNGAGDVNRDGHDDFIASAPLGPPAFVRVWSGKDGKVLYTIPGTSGLFPLVVGPAGDLDRDGFADFLASYLAFPTRFVEVRSGRTGKVLRRFTGTATAGRPTGPVCLAGDVDRDGFPDYVLLASKFDATNRYTVVVLSGKAWRVLHEIPVVRVPSRDLVEISRYGDLDHDGRDDVAVLMGPGRFLKIFSGKDASLLWSVTFVSKFVGSIDGLGDVDRDGVPDLIAGSTQAGLAHVLSGRKLALTSDVHLLSLASGGRQTLSLDAGAGEAGRNYWVLGSVTGTRPGIRLGGVLLPLNFDGYTALTLALPNSLLLRSTLGRLDARGRASASFNLPPGLGVALRGLTLHHAFLTFTPTTLRTASNAVPLTFIQ